MPLRLLWLLSILLFVTQVTISVYFSNQIVRQNNLYNQLSTTHDLLSLKNRQLQNTFYNQTSYPLLKRFSQTNNYQPITRQLQVLP
ncbi:MAG: hypothetical protein WC686_02655 [Candidatus Shapirobacteria bacterium]|jgi:hypothetical protein